MGKKEAIETYDRKTPSIIAHMGEMVHLSTTTCSWHHNRPCLHITNNEDTRTFHGLYIYSSIQWKPYPGDTSCNLPEQFYDMILLKNDLSARYILPFELHVRERSGYTVGLFECRKGLYGSGIIKGDNIAPIFFSMLVVYCAVCRRLGGYAPSLKHMTFLYTETHCVLTEIGSANVDKRERIGNREILNQKKWVRFLRKRTPLEIVRYFKLYRPELFQKKCKTTCILADTVVDDRVHQLLCKTKGWNLTRVLDTFAYLMPPAEKVIRQFVTEAQQDVTKIGRVAL